MSDNKEWLKLDPEFKAKWVAALRSGEYQQETKVLCNGKKDEPKYCCLGVAGAISGISCDTMAHLQIVIPTIAKKKAFTTYPSQLVVRRGNSLPKELARMNDGVNLPGHSLSKQYTFLEIADWVEEHL